MGEYKHGCGCITVKLENGVIYFKKKCKGHPKGDIWTGLSHKEP